MRKGSQAERNGLALWLPLPERTRGDREKPHRSPGFVDRAYLVFLNELRTTTQLDTDQVEASFSPLSRSASSSRPTNQPGYEPCSAARQRRTIRLLAYPCSESPYPCIVQCRARAIILVTMRTNQDAT